MANGYMKFPAVSPLNVLCQTILKMASGKVMVENLARRLHMPVMMAINWSVTQLEFAKKIKNGSLIPQNVDLSTVDH